MIGGGGGHVLLFTVLSENVVLQDLFVVLDGSGPWGDRLLFANPDFFGDLGNQSEIVRHEDETTVMGTGCGRSVTG